MTKPPQIVTEFLIVFKEVCYYHACGNKYISNSRQMFDVSVFVLNSSSLTKNIFHVCVSVSIPREIPAKSPSYVHLIQNRRAQNVSRMCMCIEFVIQVAKQKNAHVFVGMVSILNCFGIYGSPPLKGQGHQKWAPTRLFKETKPLWCPLGGNVLWAKSSENVQWTWHICAQLAAAPNSILSSVCTLGAHRLQS